MEDHWIGWIARIAFVGSWLLRLWASCGAESIYPPDTKSDLPMGDEWRRGSTDTGEIVLWRPRGVTGEGG